MMVRLTSTRSDSLEGRALRRLLQSLVGRSGHFSFDARKDRLKSIVAMPLRNSPKCRGNLACRLVDATQVDTGHEAHRGGNVRVPRSCCETQFIKTTVEHCLNDMIKKNKNSKNAHAQG